MNERKAGVPALSVKGLSAGYGRKVILDRVTFDIQQGEIALLVGHNGAGKSTILKGVMGLLPWTEGELHINGVNIGRPDVGKNVRSGMNMVLQNQGLFPNMTVRENLSLGAFILALDAAEERRRIDRVYAMFPRLSERQTSMGRLLSGGEQRMLSIGIALMTEPRLLLIDEPSAGLAPRMVDSVMEQLLSLNRDWGSTIVLVEQNVRAGLTIATRALVVRLGTIVGAYTSDELRNHDEIWRLF